jgi:hypothetical protein
LPPDDARSAHIGAHTMAKLIAKYLADPSLKNAQALRNYNRKHSMASCMLSDEEKGLLVAAIYQANSHDFPRKV